MVSFKFKKAVKRTLHVSAIAVSAFFINSCSSVSYLWDVQTQTESVTLSAAPGANKDFPVAVDIVAVKEKAFAQVLAETPAKTWFQQRSDFMASNPDVMWVRGFELVPGQTIDGIEFSFDDRRSYSAVFVYAEYVAPGTHRARIETFEKPKIVLGPNSIRVEDTE